MKKLIFLYIQTGLFLSLMVSCKKERVPQATAAFTIVNAVSGSDNLVANFNTNYTTDGIYPIGMYVKYRVYTPQNHLTIPAGEQPLLIYRFPAAAEQNKPVYQLSVKPNAGEASTLFLAGTLEQPETLLITKMPPFHALADSVCGLRFVNLAPAKTPVRIRISGEGTDLLVNNLAYKAATDYLSVKANAKVGDVLVEFFDQVSGILLQTYTLKDVGTTSLEKNKWRYRNYTLAWLPDDAKGVLAEEPFLIDDF
jgi:hypothetical protein